MSNKRTLDQFFSKTSSSPNAKKAAKTEEKPEQKHESPNVPKTLSTNGRSSLHSSFNSSLPSNAPTSTASTVQPASLSSLSLNAAFPQLPSSQNPGFTTPSSQPPSTHETYPFAIADLPDALLAALETGTPSHEGRTMDEGAGPHLDIVSYTPFLERAAATALFRFLRASLPYYRVKYRIQRGGVATDISTPRWTSVFGVDETAAFVADDSNDGDDGDNNGKAHADADVEITDHPEEGRSAAAATSEKGSRRPPVLVDAKDGRTRVPAGAYPTCRPRPVPACLDALRRLVEVFTGHTYNFVLVNYYAGGSDSISWHSDDERFLGGAPAIASLSLGATRDFMLRHKPLARDARKDHTAGIGGNRGTFGTRGGGRGSSRGGRQMTAAAAAAAVAAGRGQRQQQRPLPPPQPQPNQQKGKRDLEVDGEDSDIGGAEGKHEEHEEELTEQEKRVREAHRSPLKFAMAGGDMILMRGKTQSHWLHSVPKRSAKSAGGGEGGRINITFRKVLTKPGTENYYQYNVGRGPAMIWNEKKKVMVEWVPDSNSDAKEHIGLPKQRNAPVEFDNDEGWTRESSKYGLTFERKFQEN